MQRESAAAAGSRKPLRTGPRFSIRFKEVLHFMNAEKLIGEKVTHIAFGSGCVIRTQGDNYIVADFGGTERMFEYPAAFHHYLTADNELLRPFLPELSPMPAPAAVRRRGRPMQTKKKKTGECFINDEYDTCILADIVGCTI